MPEMAAALTPLLTPPSILVLEGDLGAGKTTLARALIRTLSGDPLLDVPSPTFTLLQTYDTKNGPVWHFDLYRLKDPEEIYEIGWEDALSGGGIIIIEWAERLGPLLPRNVIHVSLTPEGTGRKIEVRT